MPSSKLESNFETSVRKVSGNLKQEEMGEIQGIDDNVNDIKLKVGSSDAADYNGDCDKTSVVLKLSETYKIS